MNKEPTPHGWMQRDIKKDESVYKEPEENSIITNIDDTGTLMRMNPLLRDLAKENSQHMISAKRSTIIKKVLKKIKS